MGGCVSFYSSSRAGSELFIISKNVSLFDWVFLSDESSSSHTWMSIYLFIRTPSDQSHPMISSSKAFLSIPPLHIITSMFFAPLQS